MFPHLDDDEEDDDAKTVLIIEAPDRAE